MDSNFQVPEDQPNENNELTNRSQNTENPEFALEEQEKLFPEKLKLMQRGKKLRKLTSDLLQEKMGLNQEREQEEKAFINSEKNTKKIAEVIRNRLSFVREMCKERINAYKEYTKAWTFLNNQNNVFLQQKQSLLEDVLIRFQGQLERIEILMASDYDKECQENGDCFDKVMSECNEVEETCYKLSSRILEP